MTVKRLFSMAAVAIALAVGTSAHAGFDFTVTSTFDSVLFPGGTVTNNGATLNAGLPVSLPTSGTLNTGNAGGIDVNFAHPTVTSSSATTQSVVLPYAYDVTITDSNTNRSVMLVVTGTIGGTASATGSSLTAFGFAVTPTSADLGAPGSPEVFQFGISPNSGTGTPPNVNAGEGTLVLHVSSNAVPEPSSIALLGLGGLGALGLIRRRNAAKA